MKKVWLWNHYATAIKQGGRHFWFAKYLGKHGYECTVFCANTFSGDIKSIQLNGHNYKERSVDKIPFIYVKTCPYKGNGITRVKNMFYFYKNLFPVAKDYAKTHGKPDIILASSVHPLTMVAGIQIARKFGIPCICEIRDLWPEAIFAFNKIKETSILGRLLVKGEHWIYKNADALIFTKEGDVDYIKERKWDTKQGGDIDLGKCHYINNGVDLENFKLSIVGNSLEDKDLSDNKFKVIYAGAIRPVNNVGNLLDTARLLINEPEIRFLIYGSGIEEKMLRKRVEEEGLTNVKMKGRVKKRYIPYILSKSSVNVLNYSQDKYNWTRGNSSNKLFEYMASGKPIISTVKMGYCLLDRYKCGISLEKSTPEELAKAILYIKDMPKEEYERMGNNAALAAKDFDFKILTDKLIKVIKSVERHKTNKFV